MNLPILKPKATVYVYAQEIPMTVGFPKLIDIVDKWYAHPTENRTIPEKTDGDLFLFVNKKHTYVKVLFYSKGGYCILAKKLELGKFEISLSHATCTVPELAKWLTVKPKKAISK